jgi:hypothetical protein
MKTLFVVIIFAFLAVPLAFGQSPTYGGVTLQPGDVIAFHGGLVPLITTGASQLGYPVKPQKYGHVCMYLGNSKTGERMFLDFNTNNEGHRIVDEKRFLKSNESQHPKFDVFRPQGIGMLNYDKMIRAAKEIQNQTYFVEQRPGMSAAPTKTNNCSSAIEKVLNAGASASGKRITIKSPDDVLGKGFTKHPQQGAEGIKINVAQKEAESRINNPRPVGPNTTKPQTAGPRPVNASGGCPPGYYRCGALC